MADKRLFLLLSAVLVTFILFLLLPGESAFVEKVFSRGLFVVFRWVWDFSLGLLPFPLLYLLLLLALFLVIRFVLGKHRKQFPKRKQIWLFLRGCLIFLSILYLMFYWCWGFNYKRPDPLNEYRGSSQDMDGDYIFEELELITKNLMDLRPLLPNDLAGWEDLPVAESELRQQLVHTLDIIGLPHPGRVRARLLFPRGSLLHIGTAGVYLPFVAEGHIDPGLHPVTWPFTMIHEMSHGFGFTSEDTCNFFALLTCVNSPDTFIQYAGLFAYWRYLLSNAMGVDRERFNEYWKTIPAAILHDYQEVISYSMRYPDIMPRLRDLFYDNYLKSHGVSEGMKSYSQIIILVHGWRTKHGSLLL